MFLLSNGKVTLLNKTVHFFEEKKTNLADLKLETVYVKSNKSVISMCFHICVQIQTFKAI